MSSGDWQMVGSIVTGKARVMLHERDGHLRLKLRLLAERDPETGMRAEGNTASLSAFFESATCKELAEFRELLDRAAMPGQVPAVPDAGDMRAIPGWPGD